VVGNLILSESPAVPAEDPQRSARDRAIDEFAARFLDGENRDLYAEMLVTICRLARDGADRGEVKLLNKALAELRYAFRVFAPYRQTRKVSIFGSSRVPEDHPDFLTAREFARQMRARGWMVITGAGDGIMKAGHGGAGREASFGVAIRLPYEQKTNTIIEGDPKLVNFRYFFTRKLMFMKEASAVALFPGGFGTLDEGFEALTLIQTGKAPLIPLLLVEHRGGRYWQHWRRYVSVELLRAGMISPEDMYLFRLTDDVGAAVAEITRFYRVYHSQRYVGDDLILRLNRPVSPVTLERINDEFAARILTGGRIETCPPPAEEGGECPEKPRLRMRFDKKSFGLLRRLIDTLNSDPDPPAPPQAVE
jgi:uncharacterized protein (TIGR00730 family)